MFAMANIGGHDRKMVYRKVSNKDGYVSKALGKTALDKSVGNQQLNTPGT